jgi:hypothetical protein
MALNWRAPACYVSVAVACIFYIWVMPQVALTDLFAGAGIGAALMWALNDWELRQEVKQRRRQADGESASSLLRSRLKAAVRAARGLEGMGPTVGAPPEVDDIRRLARAAGALESPSETARSSSWRHESKAPSKPGTPIDEWRREVLTRDIERMEAQLCTRATQHEEDPYGAPDHARPGGVRPEAPDRWQRPARTRLSPR